MDLQAIVESQQQELGHCRQEIADLKALVNALVSRPPSSNPRPKLPDPNRFDGSHIQWEVWQPEIKAKLRLDSGIYDTEEAKFFYLYSRLSLKIQDLVAPQIAAAERNGYDHRDLLEQLERLCEDPNARQNAEDRLVSLYQFDDQTFNAYLLAFERQLYKSEADQWTDAAKIALVRRQLNPKLKKRLKSKDSRNVPTVYADFIKYIQRLEDGTSFRSTKAHHKEVPSDKMDIGRIQTIGAQFESSDEDTDEDLPKKEALYNPATGKYKILQRE